MCSRTLFVGLGNETKQWNVTFHSGPVLQGCDVGWIYFAGLVQLLKSFLPLALAVQGRCQRHTSLIRYVTWKLGCQDSTGCFILAVEYHHLGLHANPHSSLQPALFFNWPSVCQMEVFRGSARALSRAKFVCQVMPKTHLRKQLGVQLHCQTNVLLLLLLLRCMLLGKASSQAVDLTREMPWAMFPCLPDMT